jgi:chromosome segregation ATPase
LKTERQNQLLVSNSYIQDLQKQLEALRSAVKEETDEKYHLEDKQKNVSRELSQVALGIKNIYARCIATMSNTKISTVGGATTSSVSSVTISRAVLDHNIDVMDGRLVDLLEITREYKEALLSASFNGDLKESSLASGQTTNTGPTSSSRVL